MAKLRWARQRRNEISMRRRSPETRRWRLWVLNRWQLLLIEQRIMEIEQIIKGMEGVTDRPWVAVTEIEKNEPSFSFKDTW